MKSLVAQTILAGSLFAGAASGCFSGTFQHNIPSMVGAGFTSEDTPVPDTTSLGWEFRPTTRTAEAIEEIIKRERPQVIIVGEPVQTYWVPTNSTAEQFIKQDLPSLVDKKVFGATDLVITYLPKGIPQETLAKSTDPRIKNDVFIELAKMHCQELLMGAHVNNLGLHASGYNINQGIKLTHGDYLLHGLTQDGGANPRYLEAMQQIGKNTHDTLVDLVKKGKRPIAYTTVFSADPNLVPLRGSTYTMRDTLTYAAENQMSIPQFFRRESPEIRILVVNKIDPNTITHGGLLGCPDFYNARIVAQDDMETVGFRYANGIPYCIIVGRTAKIETGPSLKEQIKHTPRDALEKELRKSNPAE